MNHEAYIHSDYLHTALNPAGQTKAINKIMRLVKQYDFQSFAFRGMSGALLAPILAYKCKKTIIMVRKPKSEAVSDHSCYRVEGDKHTLRYLIIDDLTSSGGTIRTIVSHIAEFAPEAKCIGIILYNDVFNYGKQAKIISASRHISRDSEFIEKVVDAEAFKIKKEATIEV